MHHNRFGPVWPATQHADRGSVVCATRRFYLWIVLGNSRRHKLPNDFLDSTRPTYLTRFRCKPKPSMRLSSGRGHKGQYQRRRVASLCWVPWLSVSFVQSLRLVRAPASFESPQIYPFGFECTLQIARTATWLGWFPASNSEQGDGAGMAGGVSPGDLPRPLSGLPWSLFRFDPHNPKLETGNRHCKTVGVVLKKLGVFILLTLDVTH